MSLKRLSSMPSPSFKQGEKVKLKVAPDRSQEEAEQVELPPEAVKLQDEVGDRFEVLAVVGEGGMGTVYKVREKELDKVMAIKLLRPEYAADESAVKRFRHEAQAASDLTHANLCALYDFGVSKKGSPYIVMDYLEGQNLADVLSKEAYLDVPRALDIFMQIAEAISHAHMKGVIHRDLKPSNIIVTKGDTGSELARVVDFGISKLMTPEGVEHDFTKTGDVVGTPAYMSPEQCLGKDLDARSDIYSLGCVMYEALTGKPPFAEDNAVKTILKQVKEPPARISQKFKYLDIPFSVEVIVARCLEKDPSNRYQSMDALFQDLQAARQTLDVRPEKKKEKPNRWIRPLIFTALPCIFFAFLYSIMGKDLDWGAVMLLLVIFSPVLLLIFVPYAIGKFLDWLDKNRKSALDASRRYSITVTGCIAAAVAVVFLILNQSGYLMALRASQHLAKHNVREARDAVQAALKLDPGDSMAHVIRGMMPFFDGSDYQTALRHVDRAYEIGGDEAITKKMSFMAPAFSQLYCKAVYWHLRALLLLEMGKSSKALQAMDKAIEIDQTTKIYHIARARALNDLGRYDEALKEVAKSYEPGSEVPVGSKVEKGRALLGKGLFAEALKAADSANFYGKRIHFYDILDVRMLTVRARAYCEQGMYDQAYSALSKALQIDPNSVSTYLNRAVVAERNNRPDLARDDLAKAEELAKPGSLPQHEPGSNFYMVIDAR
ncbi:MAG TPA: serine/threonine-protein kinase [Candidatus Obscuribacterales bacterium]